MASDDEKRLPLPDLTHPTDVPPAYDYHEGVTPGHDALYAHPPHDDESSHVRAASPPAYATALPGTFPVGSSDTPPLVTIAQIEAHLRLLGAFWRLHEDVVSQDWGRLTPEARWSAFVTRSVCRFETWYLKVVNREGRRDAGLLDKELPPLDVAMIWHSYCLNPRVYFEDGLTRTQTLFKMGLPFAKLASTIDPSTLLPLQPTPDRQDTYEELTGDAFVVPLVIRPFEHTTLLCPSCQERVEVPWIVSDAETGFGQAEFVAACPSCKLRFGKEALGVRRFSEHVKAWMAEPGEVFLAGTALDSMTGLPNYEKSYAFNKRLLTWYSTVCKRKDVGEIGRTVEWNLLKVELCCRTGMNLLTQVQTPPRVRRVLSHYRHPGVFSLDLVGATLRQGTFIKKMVDLGWTGPARFAGDNTPLIRSIARYHAWLDLLSSSPSAFYVPTLDIDLVWHTHMLAAERYRSDTLGLLSRILDHEDKVEEGTLSDGFDTTARAWKARFGVPYNYCGCAPSTNGSTLDKIRGKVMRRESNAPRLVARARGDLVSMEKADGDVSHPSEHNSIVVVDHPASQKSRIEREAETAKRVDAVKRAASKGKGDEWDEVIAGRHAGHQQAFHGPRPKNGNFSYLPYIMNGASIAGGRCAAGLVGGLCQAGGGSKAFCGISCGNTWGGNIATSMNNR